MSTQRLTFLYPHLFRTARLGESSVTVTAGRGNRSASTTSNSNTARSRRLRSSSTARTKDQHHHRHHRQHAAAPFGTSTATKKPGFAPRVGKGVEPKPLGDVQGAPALESHMKKDSADGEGGASATPETRDSTPEQRKDAARALDPAADSVKETLSSPGVPTSEMKQQQQKKKQQQQQQQQQNEQPQKQLKQQPEETSSEGEAATEAEGEDGTKKKRATGPMDAVLHMEPPERQPEETRPPHLSPAPYVHHFDSYSLVKQLEDGGYTNAQAITAMKAVRAILAQNLDVAQGGLISKSDVENETYLFRAACAELSTEVKNSQRIADEQLRQQRTVLQHEMDNTTQTLNQELLTLNDNVRGMFNDRKMAVREEQKAAESMIQQIAYKISVTLNSDSKSEIEAVRWELARRAVLGIVFMVTLSLAMLRYGSYVSQVDKKEAQREKEESEALRRSGGKIDGAQGPDAAEILAAN